MLSESEIQEIAFAVRVIVQEERNALIADIENLAASLSTMRNAGFSNPMPEDNNAAAYTDAGLDMVTMSISRELNNMANDIRKRNCDDLDSL